MSAQELRDFASLLATRLDIEGGFSLVLVRDQAMRRYNRDFAGNDYATDVLSFPADILEGEEAYLGDILISVETANRQKKKDLDTELRVLALHGVLHLLGYDHETDQGQMEEVENELKKEYSLL